MEIDSCHVGTRLTPFRTPITGRRTANYAAAVCDPNPCYFDDTRPGGLLAHPVFPVAVTWPITQHLDRHLPGSSFPLELMARQVHHTEHIALHRPLRPQQTLTVAGTIAAIMPHRAGTRVVLRYEAADEDDRPVFTEHIGGMLRGVTCTDDGRNIAGLPEDPGRDPGPAPRWRRQVAIDPALPYIYDGCSDIIFPIHTSPAFARSLGLPGIIVQGTCTLALAVRELVNREAGGDPERIRALGCRFSGMVRPGTTIHVDLTARDRADLFFEVINQDGQKAISRGYARMAD